MRPGMLDLFRQVHDVERVEGPGRGFDLRLRERRTRRRTRCPYSAGRMGNRPDAGPDGASGEWPSGPRGRPPPMPSFPWADGVSGRDWRGRAQRPIVPRAAWTPSSTAPLSQGKSFTATRTASRCRPLSGPSESLSRGPVWTGASSPVPVRAARPRGTGGSAPAARAPADATRCAAPRPYGPWPPSRPGSARSAPRSRPRRAPVGADGKARTRRGQATAGRCPRHAPSPA